MRGKIIGGVVAASLSLVAFGGVAAAGPGKADGTCVAKGVANLDGPTIAGAARAGLVDDIILDHAFNGAQGIGSITGANCD